MDVTSLIKNPRSFRVRGYTTYSIHTIDEVLPVLNEALKRKESTYVGTKHKFHRHEVNVSGNRLLTYTKGLTCVFCKLARIEFFAVQSNGGKPHLNAWGDNGFGAVVLFTSDHIIPKIRGGSGALSNRQPACGPCNWQKQDRLPDEDYSPRMLAELERKKLKADSLDLNQRSSESKEQPR